jgi:hypothetical protein
MAQLFSTNPVFLQLPAPTPTPTPRPTATPTPTPTPTPTTTSTTTAKTTAPPQAQPVDCSAVHPNVPILGGLEGALCWVFSNTGVTASKDPVPPSVSRAEQQVSGNTATVAGNVATAAAGASQIAADASQLLTTPQGQGQVSAQLQDFLQTYGWLIVVVLIVVLVARHRR